MPKKPKENKGEEKKLSKNALKKLAKGQVRNVRGVFHMTLKLMEIITMVYSL